MKYDYKKVLEDANDYVSSFRGNNYYSDGDDGVEVIDLLKAKDHLEGFCIGNIIKYISRAGIKTEDSRSDLMKCFHYLIILMVLENPERYGDKNYAIDKGNSGFAEEFLDH